MTEFEAKSVIAAINRMFKDRCFSICVVRDCMKVTGAVATKELRALELYHCVSYSDMDQETKDMLFRVTLANVCNVDEFPEIEMVNKSDKIEQQLVVERRSKPLIKRLFGNR